MFAAFKASWALFLGIALIMLGNGLQGTLLGVRASLEDFSTAVTGLVMSGYYVGFLAGSTLAVRIVQSVGHIRVFAALASLASAAVLIHTLFVNPATWFAIRVVTGFCYAGLYVVAESWLNDRATNETRGQLLSIYMVIMLGGMASGQLLLNAAPPQGFELFIIASVLISLALVPISLTVGPAPRFDAPSHVSLRQLYTISPLGVLGTFGTGITHGALLGMGAVYAAKVGLSLVHISYFMGAAILGGALLQWPIGRLSDRFDRRLVIVLVTFLAAASALAAMQLSAVQETLLFGLIALYGGMTLPMYSLTVAHTNDHLEPGQMVAASSSLVLVGGLGSCLGPLSASTLMTVMGPNGFFWYLLAVHVAIGLFALYRMTRRPAAALEGHPVRLQVPPRCSPMAAVLAMERVSGPPEAGNNRYENH